MIEKGPQNVSFIEKLYNTLSCVGVKLQYYTRMCYKNDCSGKIWYKFMSIIHMCRLLYTCRGVRACNMSVVEWWMFMESVGVGGQGKF